MDIKKIVVLGKLITPGKVYSFANEQLDANKGHCYDELVAYLPKDGVYQTKNCGCFPYIANIQLESVGSVEKAPIKLVVNEFYMLKSKDNSAIQVRRWNGEFFISPNSTPIFGGHATVECLMVPAQEE